MGRKERKRYEDNSIVDELLKKDTHTLDEIQIIKEKFTGIGGLTHTNWANGQFFTPDVITKFVVDLIGITEYSRVLEPSCGGGAFLEHLPKTCDVYGIEYQHTASRVAEICYPHATIIQGDALEQEWDEPFDYVIGNPPYGLKVDDWQFDCGKKLKSEVAFVEYGMRHLKKGGILAMVIPDSMLSNQREQAFRKYFIENHQLVGVISLPINTFYHVGTQVKTSVLIFKKGFVKQLEFKVFMAMVKDIGWDNRGYPTDKSDLPAILDEFTRFRTIYTQDEDVLLATIEDMKQKFIESPTDRQLENVKIFCEIYGMEYDKHYDDLLQEKEVGESFIILSDRRKQPDGQLMLNF